MTISRRPLTLQRLFGALLVAAALFCVLLAGCRSLRVDEARRVSDGDWLTEGDGPERPNAVPVVLDPPLEEVWQFNADAGFGAVSPLVLNDIVLVATRKGEVQGIDWGSGKRRGHAGFGDTIEGSPVIGDGVLYVPVGWGGRALQAFDLARGSRRWRLKTPAVEAGLLLQEGLLIAADVQGTVHAVNAQNGEVQWTTSLGDGVSVRATPVSAGDGTVIVVDDRGQVSALELGTGRRVWSRAVGAPVYVAPAISGGRLYVSTTRGRLAALDASSGEEAWSYVHADTSVRLTAPAADDSLLVVAGSDGQVVGLSAATGRVRWRQNLEETFAAPPLLTERVIYAANLKGSLVGLDRRTGDVIWSHKLRGGVKSPMVATRGHLVVLSEPRFVYLFKATGGSYASND